MGVDFWPRSRWNDEFDKYHVFVMTCQILMNLVKKNLLDLSKVNLLVFDECHRGVNDQPMRQVCQSLEPLKEKPRILGLTATLLNGNCKPMQVPKLLRDLELSFDSRLSIVDGLSTVGGFGTNPKEIVKTFKSNQLSSSTNECLKEISKLESNLTISKNPNDGSVTRVPAIQPGLKSINKIEGLQKLRSCIKEVSFHIRMMGIYGGTKAIKAYLIQVERIINHCADPIIYELLNKVQATLRSVNEIFDKEMEGLTEEDKILKFSSPKLLELINILDDYSSTQEYSDLCVLIFTQRKFTAKVIFYILKSLSESSAAYSYIKPNFLVGFNSNPHKNSIEMLYSSKSCKKVLQSFENKEINVLCASDVMEEGGDIKACSLVVKFDYPLDYRSYIQSRGRARKPPSLFYMMVPEDEKTKFDSKYKQYKSVQRVIELLLDGKNEGPSQNQTANMPDEDQIKPYYVDGLNSAKVDMKSAIPILMQYWASLSHDQYTVLTPEYVLLINETETTPKKSYQVEIRLPVKSLWVEPIVGPPMVLPKSAKRAAALEACKKLHQIGELDEHLLPNKSELGAENVDFLFKHYPPMNEPTTGTNRRLHKLRVPQCLTGRFVANKHFYLHIIHLQMDFDKPTELNDLTLYNMYQSNLSYGLVTPNEVPSVCDFPIYTCLGAINVNLKINVSRVLLDQEELNSLKEFNVVVLRDILNGFKSFIISDNETDEAENMAFVPIKRDLGLIDFDVLRNNTTLRWQTLTIEERTKFMVIKENLVHKIVSPSLSNNEDYLVTKLTVKKPPQVRLKPLLQVEALPKGMNFFKPHGAQTKRTESSDNTLALTSKLMVKQEFPASLWIQGSFLPTIISRLTFLFRVEEFRAKMAKEMQIGAEYVPIKKPLELDLHLITYEPQIKKPPVKMLDQVGQNPAPVKMNIKEYAKKMLENEYPWREADEPKDVERDLEVSLLDIEYYEMFLSQKMSAIELTHRNKSPENIEMKALTFFTDYEFKPIERLESNDLSVGPELNLIYKAMTTIKANDIVNMERLKMLGNSFLKYIVSIYIYMRSPKLNDRSAIALKKRLVSNQNLYYLAIQKNIEGIMRVEEFELSSWVAPGFKVPDLIQERINKHGNSLASLYKIDIPSQEQISGVLSEETARKIRDATTSMDASEEGLVQDVAAYFKSNFIGDKNVADCVEALLGAYIESCGLIGGMRFMEWMDIIPASENLLQLLQNTVENPILDPSKGDREIIFHLPDIKKIEIILGYEFTNKGFLLQALTHASYTLNRITHSYERLEFLGDAILDFLITCYIFESCGNLNPGEITDLRSALVNNNTFASLVVRNSLHKHLLMINSKLQMMVDRFADYLQAKNYVIDDEVLILLEEKDVEGLNLAEYVDVPKVLGDVLEALVGAIYLDSGKDLKVVWKIFHRLMWTEIKQFSANVPKNLIRRLYEHMPNAYPEFGPAEEVENGTVRVPLKFLLRGKRKQVFGFGSDKETAEKAAAKLALRELN